MAQHPIECDAELAAHLAAGRSKEEAAAACGVSLSTVNRRLLRPAFRAALSAARAAQLQEVADALRNEMLRAVRRLAHLCEHAQHESTAVRASVALVELAAKLHDLADTGPRLAAMEALLDEREQPD